MKPFVLFGPPRVGCRVAVIGLLSDRTPWMTTPGACDSLEFARPIEAARALVKEIDADIHILLTHIGEEEDRAIAEAIPEIDLIVGGHSHTVAQERRGVPVVQTGARGLALGRVDLRIDPATFRAVVERMELLPVDPEATPADPAVAEVIRRHASGLSESLKKRVGELKSPLRRTRSLHTASAGNWISDVIRTRGEAEIAFMNKGGIRVELDAGFVTYEDLYRLMPFDNTVVAMDLTGKAILALLGRSMKAGGHPGLEWSGLTVAVEEGEKPKVVSVEAEGVPLDPDRTYRVATNSFLAAGGDGFSLFGEGKNVRNSGLLLRDALAEALAKASPLSPPEESRLRVARTAGR